MLRNTNRIQAIRQRDLARTKLDTSDPTSHAYFVAQVAMRVRSSGALQYIAGSTLSANIRSYRQMHDRMTQEQLAHINWALAHPGGRPKASATSGTSSSSSVPPLSPEGPPTPDAKFCKNLESLQRQLALAEKQLKEEREAFASVLVYIKQVTTPYQTTQIDSILAEKISVTDTDCLPPHVAHEKIMNYICTTFCTTPTEVRKRIDHERLSTGMAEDRGTYMILLDTMDLYRTILRDFDAIHFKTRVPLGMEEEICLIMERIRRGQNELQLIYADADKLRLKSGLTLEEFIIAQRAACQEGIMSLDQVQAMDEARAKLTHTGTLAQANTVAMSAMSMNPPQHQEQAYHAGYEDDDQERYQMVAFRAVDNGWRGAASSSSSSSASSSSTARGPAGRKVELNAAMLGWSAADPVPVPVPSGPPAFGGYDRSQIPPRHPVLCDPPPCAITTPIATIMALSTAVATDMLRRRGTRMRRTGRSRRGMMGSSWRTAQGAGETDLLARLTRHAPPRGGCPRGLGSTSDSPTRVGTSHREKLREMRPWTQGWTKERGYGWRWRWLEGWQGWTRPSAGRLGRSGMGILAQKEERMLRAGWSIRGARSCLCHMLRPLPLALTYSRWRTRIGWCLGRRARAAPSHWR